MTKISFVILGLLSLTACATGTRDVEVQHMAYVHQVIEQSDTKKVALANVGHIDPEGEIYSITYNVKLILNNCRYDNDWADEQSYIWSGNFENTHKSFSFTTAMGAQRTVPVYSGDCSVKQFQKERCFSWEKDCIIEQEDD